MFEIEKLDDADADESAHATTMIKKMTRVPQSTILDFSLLKL